MVARALPRGHVRHLRPLLPRPRQPGAARGRPVRVAREGRRGRGVPRARPARLRPVLPLPQAPGPRGLAGALVRRPLGGQRARSSAPRRSRPRSSSARCCSCSCRDPDRRPLGAQAAIAARPCGDDVRAHRHLPAVVLDRARALVHRRLQARVDADRGLLRGVQRAGGLELRRRGRLGLPHDPAVDRARDRHGRASTSASCAPR